MIDGMMPEHSLINHQRKPKAPAKTNRATLMVFVLIVLAALVFVGRRVRTSHLTATRTAAAERDLKAQIDRMMQEPGGREAVKNMLSTIPKERLRELHIVEPK